MDENNDSFDVNIEVNSQGILLNHTCDCESKSDFCRHKTALLLFITNSPKDSIKIKDSIKVSQLELLIDEADPEKLKAWVKSLLAKNKDFELAFTHQFSNQQKNYSPEDVTQLTLNAVKTVVNTRIKLEVSEVKKIVDLWKEIHALLINKYTAQVADENAFLNFNALVEACEATEAKMKSSSQELTKYLENLFINVLEPLHNLQSEIAWDIATGYFADRIDDGTIGLRTNYLLLLNSLLETSCMERRERLSVKVVKQYAKRKPQRYYEDEKMYTQTVFNIIKDAGLFPVYHDTFKPLSLLDDYNEKLINLLIDSGHLKMAEKYCNEQIDGYYRQENSKVYLQLLKEIYKRENDNAKLLAILKELIPKTFNFDDFLFINEQLATEDERKKWRYKILSKADNKASYDPNALAFFFNLMNHEQKYKRMLEYIRENTPYSIIVKYAEKLAMADKKDFLTRIINKSDHWRDESKDKEHYPELLGILDKYYSRDQIEWEISELEKSRWNAGRNRFVVFFRKASTEHTILPLK